MSLLRIDSRTARQRVSSIGTSSFRMVLCALLAAFSMLCAAPASAQLPGFTLTSNSPMTLSSQQYGPLIVTVTPTGGFTGTVNLACSNMPIYASCNFPNSFASVNLAGSPVAETIVINTSQINEYQSKTIPAAKGMSRVTMAALFAPAAFLLLFARRRGMKFGATSRLLLCVLALYPLAGLAGCAAVKPNATPAGTYNFVVSGVFSGTSSSTVVTLKVT